MKKYISIIITMLIIGTVNNLSAQQMFGKWIVPVMFDNGSPACNVQLTFSEAPVSHIILPTAELGDDDGGVSFSAGGYSPNYDWNFYVVGERLFDRSGSEPWENFSYESFPEYQIINKPQSINEYFTFFTYINYHERSLISYNTITYNPDDEIASASEEIILGEYDNGYAGFAITEEQDNQRYLFVASTEEDGSTPPDHGLYRWTITNSGLSEKTPIVQSATSDLSEEDFDAYNLEHKIDYNGKDVIAWIHGEMNWNIVDEIVVVIDGSPNILEIDLGRIGGIEFSTIDDNILYVSCTDGGIVAIDYNTGEIIYLHSVAPDYNYGRTFLQTAPDGNIYGVSNDGTELGRIMQTGSNAGNFESEDVFTFPYGGIKTFKVFGETSYYILPENQHVHNFLTLNVITTPVCPDQSDGTATINVEGGLPDYTYQLYIENGGGWVTWGDAVTTTDIEQTFTGLAEGTYKCTVTDDDNNTEEIEFSITDDKFDINELEEITSYDPAYWTDVNRTYKLGFIISGNTRITINSSTLQFGKYAKIVIEPGSELIVNHSTLTHYAECYDPWQGIQVWGVEDQHQYSFPGNPCAQGTLIVENNSIIENAVSAVELWNPGDDNSTGGIVQAEDSYFKNNSKSIHAINYTNYNPSIPSQEMNNVSYFKNCTFDVNNSYIVDEHIFYKHVDLAFVKGFNFEGCDFSMSATDGVSDYNIGIAAYDAGFSVAPICLTNTIPCDSYDKCNFNGFYNGIRATSGGKSTNTFSVFTSNFTNNSTGVYVSYVNNAVIVDNAFEIGYNTKSKELCDGNSYSYGIDIQSSIGFAIEDNTFTKLTGADMGYYTGIRVFECPSVADVIYNNDFVGLSYGNYAYGTNRAYPDSDDNGLIYQCNTNTDNTVDFIVTHEVNSELAMIHMHHGINDVQASGNTFSTIYDPEINWHFRNEGKRNINWYYCDDDANCPDQTPTNYMDNCEGGQICFTPIDAPEYNCPSHYGNGGDIKMDVAERQQAETDYAINLVDYANVKVLYDNLNDGGNTTAKLLDIQTATPNDMWALRAQLLGDSPHLSKEVLKEAADKTDVLPESAIFDIMAANPDEIKKAEMINYLESKDEPLPDYMISLLKQISNGSTYKTVLLHDMADYHAEKTKATQDIIRSILADSVVDQVDYRNWLSNLESLAADKQIIDSYLQEGNTAYALTLLNMLPDLYELEGNELNNHNNYSYIINLHITLQNEDRNINQLINTELDNLVWIAESTSSSAKSQARNVLEYAYDYHYCDCQYISDATVMKSSGIINHDMGKAMGLSITVKPNPASDWAQFSYQLPYKTLNGEIIITDITGKFIDRLTVTGAKGMKIWDTRNIPKGVYLYILRANGFSSTGKIVIGR